MHVKVDYKPKRINYTDLTCGDFRQLLNLFPLEGALLNLKHVHLVDVSGWKELADKIVGVWIPHVKWDGIVRGIQPLRPLLNIGSGVADLVLLPLQNYQQNGRILAGLQRGTSSFLRSIAMETLNVGSRMASGTQGLLQTADYFVSPDTHNQPQNSISRFAHQPANTSEGIQSAYESLSREIQNTARTIIAVPIEEYQRSGATGCVKSVVRAVPVAILRPMIGFSEGLSKTLLGLRNQLEPNLRISAINKYKE